ncbi:MAG: hypothetical protein Q8O83_01090 [bacterium]|nr:hypothetical protein [bacterium]
MVDKPNSVGDKFTLRDYLDKITGSDDKPLTREQLNQHRQIIIASVQEMRRNYEKTYSFLRNNVEEYYASCWEMFDGADNDDKLIDAIQYLRSSIKWQ